LTTASGAKMGKTARGAIWLDTKLCSPYEFYQYWVNCDDRDVGRFLKIYTLLTLDEIGRLEMLKDKEINEAKRILAYEATKITHGEREAEKARRASAAAFGGEAVDRLKGEGDINMLPTTVVPRARLEAGISPAELFAEVGLTPSRAEAKRLIRQGGLYANEERIDSLDRLLTVRDLGPDGLMLKAGKKKIHRIMVR
jgi:tyrosyl-tRNA synthetase